MRTSFSAVNIHLFKVNNRNTRKRCGICQWRRSGAFIVNFEHIFHLFLVFLLLNLNSYMFAGKASEDIAQNMKFSVNYFSSKCDQICRFLRIWSHLLKKSLMKNFNFCAVSGLRKSFIKMSRCKRTEFLQDTLKVLNFTSIKFRDCRDF